MDLKKLRHATVLADEGSFARAADKLHITQSALSRSIQTLETSLGLVLFDRNHNGVRLNKPGKHLIGQAREILRMSNGLLRDAELIQGASLGNIVFGLGPIPANMLLPAVLPDIINKNPKLDIQVEIQPSAQLLNQLLKENLEFFIADITLLDPQAGIETLFLAQLPIAFYTRREHPLAQEKSVTLYQLSSYTLASPRFDSTQQHWLEMANKVSWSGGIACEELSVLKSVALNTDAILMTATDLIASELSSKTLVPLAIKDFNLPWPLNLSIVKLADRNLSPVAALFIEAMKGHLNN